MIISVKVTAGIDGDMQSAEMTDVFDDNEQRIEHEMTITRCYGKSSCQNPYGTDDKIEVNGDFTYKETDGGSMKLTDVSQDALTNAVTVFKAIFGERFAE
jgi:hypothetical protein